MAMNWTMNDWMLYGVVFLALAGAGVLYDQFVTWMERTGRERGVTAFLVVGGTLMTLLGAWAVFGAGVFLGLLGLFGASGLPMVVGSWRRYTDARGRDERDAQALAGRMLGLSVEDHRAVEDVEETG